MNSREAKKLCIKQFKISDYGVLIGFIVLCIIVGIAAPTFFSPKNLLNLLRQSSIVGIISVGMTGVILSGNFDVSVGSIAAISGAICMKLLSMEIPMEISLLAAIVSGLIIGMFNGIIIAKLGIPSLIATMSTKIILTGVILFVSGGYPISGSYDFLENIGNGYISAIPVPVIIMASATAIMFFFLVYTKRGRYVYSVGGNEEASHLCGIKTDRIKVLVFAICGALSALAGIVLTARLGTASPLAGDGYDMDAISSVVIGGTSVLGGEGSVLKTLIGVLFMSVINNAFNLLGIEVFIQYIVKGLIIIIAVGASSYSRKKAMTA